ncbi:hypothetical protein ALQ94_102575 [Pseudomonas amygdali pv. morsprunorum]|uniref:Uncharacterized protein n=1 Tax=Pseudomonas amygdali pv. morsprunorum TaxID=129138 RepID=A0A3M2WIN0_PSEA0|nr:hypothetical protein ALQ94_102575 [Pseudomonas amygdali pv. morsprunorum]
MSDAAGKDLFHTAQGCLALSVDYGQVLALQGFEGNFQRSWHGS